MTVIWFNDDDDSTHTVTFNDTDHQVIDYGMIEPGGFFIHQFSVPGTYDYCDSYDPLFKGRIEIGAKFEPGQNMNMLIGGDALPFEVGKIGRTNLSFVPNDNFTSIPPSSSITYNVTIAASTGRPLYSNQFGDSDGILDRDDTVKQVVIEPNRNRHIILIRPDLFIVIKPYGIVTLCNLGA